MTWKDPEEIAQALCVNYPGQDPLRLSFPQLLKMIRALPDFSGNPAEVNEALLERIQMAWLEERP